MLTQLARDGGANRVKLLVHGPRTRGVAQAGPPPSVAARRSSRVSGVVAAAAPYPHVGLLRHAADAVALAAFAAACWTCSTQPCRSASSRAVSNAATPAAPMKVTCRKSRSTIRVRDSVTASVNAPVRCPTTAISTSPNTLNRQAPSRTACRATRNGGSMAGLQRHNPRRWARPFSLPGKGPRSRPAVARSRSACPAGLRTSASGQASDQVNTVGRALPHPPTPATEIRPRDPPLSKRYTDTCSGSWRQQRALTGHRSCPRRLKTDPVSPPEF
jgi:hypothetical protein